MARAVKRSIAYLRNGTYKVIPGWNIFAALDAAKMPAKDVEFFTDLTGPRYLWSPTDKAWVKGENPMLEEELISYISSEHVAEAVDNTGV